MTRRVDLEKKFALTKTRLTDCQNRQTYLQNHFERAATLMKRVEDLHQKKLVLECESSIKKEINSVQEKIETLQRKKTYFDT